MHAYARIHYGHRAAVTKDADKVEEFCVQQRLSFAIRTGQESINPMPLQQTSRSIVSLDDYRAPWEMDDLAYINYKRRISREAWKMYGQAKKHSEWHILFSTHFLNLVFGSEIHRFGKSTFLERVEPVDPWKYVIVSRHTER